MELAALGVTLTLNFLARGRIAFVSDAYRVAATPPPFTFGIWAVIYGLWAATLQSPADPYFVRSLISSNVWLWAWCFERLGMSFAALVAYAVFTARVRRKGGVRDWARSVTLSWTVAAAALNALSWASLDRTGCWGAVVLLAMDGLRAAIVNDWPYVAARAWALNGCIVALTH